MRPHKKEKRNTFFQPPVMSQALFLMNKHKIPKILLDEAKRQRQIIYGAQAMNLQLPLYARRSTQDWDIFARHPRKTASRIQRRLDREVAGGKDDFYAKPALHAGTHKVMHEGFDNQQGTEDDVGIADYTKMPSRSKKPPTIRHKGVLYEGLRNIEKGKKKTLRDPKSKYRHAKDRGDVERIRHARVMDRLLNLGNLFKKRRKK